MTPTGAAQPAPVPASQVTAPPPAENVSAGPADPLTPAVAGSQRSGRAASRGSTGAQRRSHFHSRASCSKQPSCITSPIAMACCTPRMSVWSRWRMRRHAVLLLFERDHRAALSGVRRRLRGCGRARLLLAEGEFQPGRDRDPGAAWRRRRRSLRRRTVARPAAGIPREQNHVFRRRQDAAELRSRSIMASSASTSSLKRRSSSSPRLRPARAARADISIRVNPDIDAKTHAKIATGKAENKFGIPISRAPRCLRARRQAQRRARGRRRHAYRQPDRRARSFRRRVCAAGRLRRRAARRRPHHQTPRSRRRARHSVSARTTNRRQTRTLTRRSSSAPRPASAASSSSNPAGSSSAMPAFW